MPMHMEFGIMLYLALHVSPVIVFHFATATAACVGPSNSTDSSYFHAFESLQPSNKHTYGCASDNTHITTGASQEVYRENHVIIVENDRTSDIYLNINGFHNGTKNSLPHTSKYEFALFSRKDVIWLVSTEHLPSNGVFFKFYYHPSGSQIIFRDGRQVSSVEVTFGDAKHMTSRNFFHWCKNEGIFQHPQITSFTEVPASAVAAVSIATGNKQDAPLQGKFTGCATIDRAYVSPIVSVEHCEAVQPILTCHEKFPVEGGPKRKKAFILDVVSEASSEERMKVINLELVGKEASGDENSTDKILVALRSRGSVEWHVHFEKGFNAADFLFVISRNGKLVVDDIFQDLEVEYQNLDYDEFNQTVLTSGIEALYESTVVSYSQYDSQVDLIFLRSSDSENSPDVGFTDRSSLLGKAYDVFRLSRSSCEDGQWSLYVPVDVLEQHGLTEQNLRLRSSGKSDGCQAMTFTDAVYYDLNQCSTEEDGVRSANMEVTFKGKTSKHLFTAPGPQSETMIVPLKGCQKQKTESDNFKSTLSPFHGLTDAEGIIPEITSSCMEGLFVIKIPNQVLGTLDVSGLSECDRYVVNDRTEYTIESDGPSICGAVFKEGMIRIEIPKKSSPDGADLQPVVVSCSFSTEEVTMNYHLRVFDDFNLKNPLMGMTSVKRVKEDTDETTYHFQVLAASSDRSLTAFLSSCSLKQNLGETRLLIKNNCPASKAVSFVRSMSKFANHTQHFALKMRGLLATAATGFHKVVCEVSACALEPCYHCIPSVPQCVHLHGDGCMESSIDSQLAIAPYLSRTISSSYFELSEQTGIVAPRTNGPNKREKIAQKPVDEPTTMTNASTNSLTFVVLTLTAFTLGCVLVALLAFIHKRYPRKPASPRKSERDGGGESGGSSRSAGSTETTRSSFGSRLCFKSGKSSSPSSQTSSKDDLEMEKKSFIEARPPTSATHRPQIVEVMSEITTDGKTPNGCNEQTPHSTQHSQTFLDGAAAIRGSTASSSFLTAQSQTSCRLLDTNRSREVAVTVHAPCKETIASRDIENAASDSPSRRESFGTNDDGRCVPPAYPSAPFNTTDVRFASLKEVAV